MALMFAILAPLLLAVALVPVRKSVPIADAALVMVVITVAVAATGSRRAGYVAAISSAVWFDFFLTRPYERLAITRRDDLETTLLLVAIGIGVTELAVWGWRQRASAMRRAEHLDRIIAARDLALSGDRAAVGTVETELRWLLDLRRCRFEPGVAGLGTTARLRPDGTLTVAGEPWNVESRGLPLDQEIELLVEGAGVLQGRFVMAASEGSAPSVENRLVAALLADQLGIAIARQRGAGRQG